MSSRSSLRISILAILLFWSFLLSESCGEAAPLQVVSFNIQFLGHFKKKDNEALAKLLSEYDLVFIQELVAPPMSGNYPDGTSFKADKEAKEFFDAMTLQGFSYELSEEDTGTGEDIHKNSSATEWFVAFYKPQKVKPANDLANGFLAEDRSNHPDYERVPYAFPFRAGNVDLVFISVHLQPGGSKKETARRAHELESIFDWINRQDSPERDYVVLGDMNIENCEELALIMPTGLASLNGGCIPTNTNPNAPNPYDHIIYHVKNSANEMASSHFQVINLVDAMEKIWDGENGSFPGIPYRHKDFRMRYSDHHPVAFTIHVDGRDDD